LYVLVGSLVTIVTRLSLSIEVVVHFIAHANSEALLRLCGPSLSRLIRNAEQSRATSVTLITSSTIVQPAQKQ
jgi:hypothetical protein